MDKRDVLQAVKEAKRQYLLWSGRVVAVVEGAPVKGEGGLAEGFERWHTKMAKVLKHFEEYQAMEDSHQRADQLFQQIQTELAGENPKGWAARLLSAGGLSSRSHAAAQLLLAGFKREATEVVEHFNRLERLLLVMRSIEWEKRQNGTWGLSERSENFQPADWAVITQH